MTKSSPKPTLLIKDFAVTEGKDAVFIIGASAPLKGPNTIHLYIDSDTAEESDYNLRAAQISYDGVTYQPFTNDSEVGIAVGKDCIYIKVPTIDDGLVEHERFSDTEKFTITANPVDGFSGGAVVETASIIDNDIQRISVVSNGDKTEGDYASWTISIDKEPDHWSWAQLDLVDGTTQRSIDYDPNTLEVSIDGGAKWTALDEGDAFGFAFKPGLTSAQVRVKTTDDSVLEQTESLILKVTPNPEGLEILAPDVVKATVNIKDNDSGVPTPGLSKVISVSSPRAIEGDREIFDIQLSSATTAPTTVVLAVTPGTANLNDLSGNFEYSFDGTNWSPVNNARVEVPTGKSGFQVRVLTAEDQLVEGNETFTLTADANGGRATGTATIENKTVVVTPPVTPVKVGAVDDATAPEGGFEVFKVNLTAPTTAPTKVDLALTGDTATLGTDFENKLETSFDGGKTWVPVTGTSVDVAVGKSDFLVRTKALNDEIVEGPETFKLTASANGGSDTGIGTIQDKTVALPKVVSVSSPRAVEGDREVFDIKLSSTTTAPTTVALAVNTGTADFNDLGSGFEYSFDGINWSPVNNARVDVPTGKDTFKVRVLAAEDQLLEGDETFTLTADANGGRATGTATIENKLYVAPVKVGSVGNATAPEGGFEVFKVNLTAPTTAPTKVDLALTGDTATLGTDFENKLETSFDSGTTWTPVTGTSVDVGVGKTDFLVRTKALNDEVVEGPETFKLTAGANGVTATGVGTIEDKTVLIQPKVVSVSSPRAGEGDREVFDIQLSAAGTTPTTVTLNLTPGTATAADLAGNLEYSFDGTTWVPLTGSAVDVPAGKTAFQVRTLTAVDQLVEGDETFTLTAASNGGTATGTATIVDKTVLVKVGSVDNATAPEGNFEVFKVNLTGTTTAPTRVDLTLAGDTATLGTDFENKLETSFDGGITWVPVTGNSVDVGVGKTDFLVRTKALNDNVLEGPETFKLTAGANGGTATGIGTIEDKTVPIKVGSVDNATAPEGNFEVFKVNLTGTTTAPTRVDLTLAGDTATLGTDFENKLETSFDGGQTWVPVTGNSVDVGVGKTDFLVRTKALNDNVLEGPETFKLTAGANGGTATGVGTIEDKTVPVKVGSVDNATAPEGNFEVFKVNLTGTATAPTRVDLTLAGDTATLGTDFENKLETSFDDGTTWVPVTGNSVDVGVGKTDFLVRTKALNDDVLEGNETFKLTAGANGGTATGIGTIEDKTVPVKVGSVGNATAPEGGFEVFKVNLTSTTTAPTKVDLTLAGDTATLGTDFENKLETSFDGGTTWVPVTGNSVEVGVGKTDFLVRTKALNDDVLEGPETFKLTAGANGGTATGVGTIEDKTVLIQPKVVSVSSPRAGEGDREVFDIQLSAAGTTPTTVTLNLTPGTATAADLAGNLEYSFDGTNWTALSGATVDVPAGKTAFQVRTLTAVDQLIEGDETFTLTAASNGGTATGTATIVDKTVPVLIKVGSVGDATAPEGGFEVFKVNLTGTTTAPTRVDLTLAGDTATLGTDFENKLETSFDGGQTWVPVTGNSVDVGIGKSDFLVRTKTNTDNIFEGNETLKLTAAANGGTGTGTGTIEDANGSPKVTSVSSPTAKEGDREVFTIKLSGASTTPTDVQIALTPDSATLDDLQGNLEVSFDGTIWTAINGSTVTVPAGRTDFQIRTLTNDDTLVEGNETFKLTATANGGAATGVATITDNDVAKPAPKAKLVGNDELHEGGDHGKYTVQLDQVSDKDQFFTIQINDGKAQRYDGDGSGQDFVWGGAYDIADIGKVFYGRVPNDNINGYNNRAAVGPEKGDASWDYSVYKGGEQNKGNTITVKVAAGQTTSEEFSIQAWKEKVTVDQDYWNPNGLNTTNYNEGQENFTLKITDAGGIEVTQGELGVKINDKTNYNLVSPIAIDLNGDGIQTIALEAGVTFDIFNNGQQTNVGWLSGDDAFLAIDSNNNGEIDDRGELFGGNVGEGFAKLETFDSNKDGVVDSGDDLFGDLKIWRDVNVNGKTEAGELSSLSAANIAALNVAYTNQFSTDAQGNVLGEKSTAIDTSGRSLDMIDIYFRAGQ
jgi:Calx-beta domain